MLRHLARILPLSILEKLYLSTGHQLGEAISYAPIAGEAIGFDKTEKRFEILEAEYSRRGFKPVPRDSFIDYGGYGKSITHLTRIKH